MADGSTCSVQGELVNGGAGAGGDVAATRPAVVPSETVYLLGPTPSFTHAVFLGAYKRQQGTLVNGRPLYVQERPPSANWEDRVLWHTRNGEWTASWRSNVEPDASVTRGFLTIAGKFEAPDGLADGWFVATHDGAWAKAPYVRCLSGKAGSSAYRRVKEEEEAKRHGAAPRLIISLIPKKEAAASKDAGYVGRRGLDWKESEPLAPPQQHDPYDPAILTQISPWFGEYQLSDELVNERQAYRHVADASRMLWFSDKQGYWVLGISNHVGSAQGKAFAEAVNKAWWVPEHLHSNWLLYDDETTTWIEIPILRIRVARNGRWKPSTSNANKAGGGSP